MQSAIATAWAHQDCQRPLDLSKQQAAKIKALKEQLVESDKKLSVREKELKTNAIDLVAKSEELKKAQVEIGLLKGEVARHHKEGRSLRLQLEQAKVVAANAVSKYQSSEEMAALKQNLHDEGYEDAAEVFAYIVVTTCRD